MDKEKFYFLRKVDDEFGDRALYRHNWLNRYYRSDYPTPHEKCFKLYKAKRLSTILRHREALHEYCAEWFDVYDQDRNIVDIKGENNE